MRKILKENKGFSLVELLVAILIMAVIAATAIALFGGVLDSSRKSADDETAESIKRAILTYMNMSNDVDLSAIGVKGNGSTPSEELIEKLCCTITLADDDDRTATFKHSTLISATAISPAAAGQASDIPGTYGPFLDPTKELTPKTPGTEGWRIEIDKDAQVITVKATDNTEGEGEGEGKCVVVFKE